MYESLPVELVAIFAHGLKSDARVWRKFRQADKLGAHDFDRELLVLIYDKLNWIAWTKTEAALENQGRPESLYKKLFMPEQKQNENPDDAQGFESPEAFKKAWEELRSKSHGNNDRGSVCADSTIS